jgi:hypothetical protein
MEKNKVGLADNLEAVSPDFPAVNEEERLEGQLGAARDLETWGFSDANDEQKLEADEDDWKRDILEEHLNAQADELFELLFSGFLSSEEMKAAFKVKVTLG